MQYQENIIKELKTSTINTTQTWETTTTSYHIVDPPKGNDNYVTTLFIHFQ